MSQPLQNGEAETRQDLVLAMKVPKGQLVQDPLELQRKKNLAKLRFRALVRRVIDNLYWLQDDEEVYEGDNVKKRVEQAMRAKSKKTLLDLQDKALLNKPAKERTEQEKKYIYRKIGGLKCFKRYPNHVKKKLAAETYFVYYAPGRVIVRQNQEAHAMYFIVTGEVVVSILIFDPVLQKQVSINVFVMHPGDMFGEVSLLHNIKRTATCTTSAHCQFLALMKKDFKIVLQDSLQKQWDEVKQAMNSFTYFKGLDEVARREGCIVAKMKSFDPNETIMGDGAGVPNFVYFVLSGECQMIESLKISKCTTVTGKKVFSLYDPHIPEETEDDIDFETKYNFKLRKAKRLSESKPSPRSSKATAASTNPDIEKQPGDFKTSEDETSAKKASEDDRKEDDKKDDDRKDDDTKEHGKKDDYQKEEKKKEDDQKVEDKEEDDNKEDDTSESSSDSQFPLLRKTDESLSEDKPMDSQQKELNELPPENKFESPHASLPAKSEKNHSKEETVEQTIISVRSQDARVSVRIDIADQPKKEEQSEKEPPNLRTYFMQVCIFKPGSTFGFGENMRDRRIVAMTRVDCMLLPKIWLMQKNTANIWSRIQHYLEKKIPTKKQLFKEFVQQRRWLEWRDSIIEDIYRHSKTVNHTTYHDVPYSIRMKEFIDI